MSKYAQYSHKKVIVSEVLDYLDEFKEEVQKSIYRVQSSDNPSGVMYQVGKLQGIDIVLKRLENQFGVQDT